MLTVFRLGARDISVVATTLLSTLSQLTWAIAHRKTGSVFTAQKVQTSTARQAVLGLSAPDFSELHGAGFSPVCPVNSTTTSDWRGPRSVAVNFVDFTKLGLSTFWSTGQWKHCRVSDQLGSTPNSRAGSASSVYSSVGLVLRDQDH